MNEKTAVYIKDVRFSYGDLSVLEDVNVEIEERDLVCVVGPNGGGKTTLLKIILGLLRPQAGEVRVLGRSPVEARSRVGYIAQYAHVDPGFPVGVMDVVLMGRLGTGRGLGFYSKNDRNEARQALEMVGMESHWRTPFSNLSGGQRQRVLIARALVCRPELLLLDEPTSNLDLVIEEELYRLIKILNEKMTIMLVSHDLGFVSQIVKSVVCVNRRVVVHPTTNLSGDIIKDIYGGEVRMVRHDHRCAEGGHEWPTS